MRINYASRICLDIQWGCGSDWHINICDNADCNGSISPHRMDQTATHGMVESQKIAEVKRRQDVMLSHCLLYVPDLP